jgi:ATP-binding cassette subfamily G (WHITE) protein 2
MVTIFFALILGGIYSNIGLGQKSIQNRNGLLFFVGINQGFNGLIGVLNTFPKEKNIVNRERAGRAYDTASYFFAKLFVEIPLNVLPSIIFSCIIYWMVGLNPDRFGEFIGISMLVTITAIALGLAVSAAVPTVEAANAVGPPMMVIGILFGGFYIDINSLPIVANWIPYFSFLRWSFQAYAINEYKGLVFDCVGAAVGACRKTGEEVLISLSFDGHTTAYPVFGMGMVLLAFVAIAYTILHNSKAKYTPMGWKGAKFEALAAAGAGSGGGSGSGSSQGQSAVVAVVEVAEVADGVQMKEQP